MAPHDLSTDAASLNSRASALLGRVREYSVPRRITDLASRLSFFGNEILFATGVSSIAFGTFVGVLRWAEILDKYTTAALIAPLVVLCTSAWSMLAFRYRMARPGTGVHRGIYVLEEEIRKAEANPRTPPDMLKQLYSMKVETISLLANEWQSTKVASPRLSIKGD